MNLHYSLNLTSIFREHFIRCGGASDEGTISIRAGVTELYKSWSALEHSGELLISFTNIQ